MALVEAGPRGVRVLAASPAARRAGVTAGVALADARAVVPDLVTHAAEPERDGAALAALAGWAGRYGPHRNGDGADGLWIDITGVAHLYGGEDALVSDIAGRLGRARITARVGLADTLGAAHALARHATSGRRPFAVASPGGTRAAIASLPVDALRIGSEAVVLLRRLGLKRIGQLYDLPRGALEHRFRDLAEEDRPKGAGAAAAAAGRDAAGVVLSRLDQALGRAREPRGPLVEAALFEVRAVLPEPLISGEGVARVLDELSHRLARDLERAERGARRIRAGLYRVDGTAAFASAGTSAPSRDPRHILRLLSERLGDIDAGFGIDAVVLDAPRVERMAPAQPTIAPRLEADLRSDPAVLVDRLVNRLGAARVHRLARVESHLPEQAWRLVPAGAEPEAGAGRHAAVPHAARSTSPKRTRRAKAVRSGQPAVPDAAAPSPVSATTLRIETRSDLLAGAERPDMPIRRNGWRPAFLLERPEAIAVTAEVPDGPPVRFTWRRVQHRVRRAQGPERIEAAWWQWIAATARAIERAAAAEADGGEAPPRPKRSRPRDYYRLEDERGGRFWVFREGLYGREEDGVPDWFMHGLGG